jgi:hypothetical protein
MNINYEDEKVQQEIRQIISDVDLCPCGSGGKYEIVKLMLERAEAKGCFYGPLIGEDLSGKAVEFIAAVMSSSEWDLLEHGTGIGWAWMTDRGETLLQFFRDKGTDQDEWPEWVQSCPVDKEW